VLTLAVNCSTALLTAADRMDSYRSKSWCAPGSTLSFQEEIMTNTQPARAATRQASGIELPAPGRWQIDPGHTELAFIGRHFMRGGLLVSTEIRIEIELEAVLQS
jgi:hypothetical protein